MTEVAGDRSTGRRPGRGVRVLDRPARPASPAARRRAARAPGRPAAAARHRGRRAAVRCPSAPGTATGRPWNMACPATGCWSGTGSGSRRGPRRLRPAAPRPADRPRRPPDRSGWWRPRALVRTAGRTAGAARRGATRRRSRDRGRCTWRDLAARYLADRQLEAGARLGDVGRGCCPPSTRRRSGRSGGRSTHDHRAAPVRRRSSGRPRPSPVPPGGSPARRA